MIPRAASFTSQLHIDPADAEFLAGAMPKLPGAGDDRSPVTLDLVDDRAVVRAGGPGSGPTAEVGLDCSSAEGKPVRLCLDRTLLRRALLLGCTELGIAGADKPVLASGDFRLYFIMPLAKEGALLPTKDALAISSKSPIRVHAPHPTPRRTTMPEPPSNGNSKSDHVPTRPHGPTRGVRAPERTVDGVAGEERGPGIGELITEAEGLRDLLHDAAGRVARLLAGLKQHRRQSRAVRAAMQSLRLLKIDG